MWSRWEYSIFLGFSERRGATRGAPLLGSAYLQRALIEGCWITARRGGRAQRSGKLKDWKQAPKGASEESGHPPGETVRSGGRRSQHRLPITWSGGSRYDLNFKKWTGWPNVWLHYHKACWYNRATIGGSIKLGVGGREKAQTREFMTDCIVQNSGLVFANIHYIHSLCKKKAFSCRTLDGFRKNPKIPSLPSLRHPQNRLHKSNKVTMSVIQQKVFASKAFILRISLNGRPELVNRTSFRQNSGFCNFFRNEKAWYRPFNNSNTLVEWAYLKKSI